MGCEPIEENLVHNGPVAAKRWKKDDGSHRSGSTNN